MKAAILVAVVMGVASAQLVIPGLWDDWFSGHGRPAPEKKHCQSASDCEATECCVHGAWNKRFMMADFDHLFAGECKPYQTEGEYCVPFAKEMTIFNTNAHFALCPCEPGLVCASDRSDEDHPVFGKMTTHTNTMCSKPEQEGSGEIAN